MSDQEDEGISLTGLEEPEDDFAAKAVASLAAAENAARDRVLRAKERMDAVKKMGAEMENAKAAKHRTDENSAGANDTDDLELS